MTAPKKAIESRDVRLTLDEIANLNGICEQTLNAQPQLSPWVKNIVVAPGMQLPFLPIRCFRLTDVSRFKDAAEAPQGRWAAEFLSSGSTNTLRARHRMSNDGFEAYRKSALEGWRYACHRLGIPSSTPVLSLIPPGESNPDSSLSMMLSLWRDGGVPVHFIDLNHNQDTPANSLRTLQSAAAGLTEFVLFGTSLHHLQVLQWQTQLAQRKLFKEALRVWCIDTGGTKGRTQSTNQSELHAGIQSYFSPQCQVHFLSEYGMCELGSQAYSSHSPHVDFFECSPKLRVVAVSPQLDRILPHEQKGFLGFIDFANIDSWPCLVSEDLGMTVDGQTSHFRLLGRSPDATLKGCSLNVRNTYRFDLETRPQKREVQHNSSAPEGSTSGKRQRRPVPAQELLARLPHADWPECAREALRSSIEDWEAAQSDVVDLPTKLFGESIAIVTSANIPIAWLFPALHAWLMNAAHVTLYLPSLRPDDPLTALVRRQIVSLTKAFNHLTQENFIQVRHHRLFADATETVSDRILVFGSDDTLRTIAGELARLRRTTKLVALGHFQNAMLLENSSRVDEIADILSLWMGRGCLTPLRLEVPNTWENERTQAFAADLFAATRNKRQRWSDHTQSLGADSWQQFSHQHNLVELSAICAAHRLKIDVLHCSESGTVIIDATPCGILPESISLKLNDFAGSGWVNLVVHGQTPTLPHHNPIPSLCEEHQGFLWRDWFFNTTPIGE